MKKHGENHLCLFVALGGMCLHLLSILVFSFISEEEKAGDSFAFLYAPLSQ